MPNEADGLFATGVNGVGTLLRSLRNPNPRASHWPRASSETSSWYSKRRNRDLQRVIEPTEPLIECYSGVRRPLHLPSRRPRRLQVLGPTPDRRAARLLPGAIPVRPREFRGPERPAREDREGLDHAGALMGAYLFDDEIFYRNNSGFNFPIAAEHVNLHLAMRAQGRGRFLHRAGPSLPLESRTEFPDAVGETCRTRTDKVRYYLRDEDDRVAIAGVCLDQTLRESRYRHRGRGHPHRDRIVDRRLGVARTPLTSPSFSS